MGFLVPNQKAIAGGNRDTAQIIKLAGAFGSLGLVRQGDCKVLDVLGVDGGPILMDTGNHQQIILRIAHNADMNRQPFKGLQLSLDTGQLRANGVLQNPHISPPSV